MSTIKFTDRYVKSLKPTGVQFQISDSTGLMLRVSQNGKKTWCYRYRFEDGYRRLKLGNYPKISLADAREKHAKAIERRDLGSNPASQKIKNTGTVRQLADEFYSRYLINERSRPDIPKQMLDADIVPVIGGKKLIDITPRDIIQLLDLIVDRSARTQANRVLSLVKQMFSFGVSRGLLETNPASEIKRSVIGGKESPRDRTLSMEEIESVWLALQDYEISNTSPQIRLALKILILTGVRSGEIRTAEWDHVHFDNNLWVVPKERTKTKITHKVYLSPLTKKIFYELKEFAGDNRYVMPSAVGDKPFTDKAISKAADRLQERIGIEKWTAHDLRRTFSTQLSQHLKIQPHIVEKCLGHKLPKIMETYNKNEFLDERREALEQWATRIERLVDENSNIVEFDTVKALDGNP